MANIIECQSLTKCYQSGSAPALDHATFSIPDKSGIVGLLGPNGSGKTTLIKLLTDGQTKDAFSKVKSGGWEYDIKGTWYKCNMTNISAAMGLAQLKKYDGFLKRRQEIIEKYNEAFIPMGIEVLEHFSKERASSGHLYLTRIKGIGTTERQSIIDKMTERGISVNVHYKPLPLLSAYKEMGYDIKDYPNAYVLYQNEITLPLHTLLSDDDVEYVIKNYCEIVKEYI